MYPVKINLLESACGPQPTERCKRRSRAFYVFAFVLIFAGFFGLGRLSLSETASAALARLDDIPFFHQMHLIASPDRQLSGEGDDRVNILLLGMGGQGHDGPMLTDTIIVASIRPSDSKVALLSIPRDMLIPLGDYGWRKINAANAYGEMTKKGTGPELARTAIEGMLGIEIPYYVRVDFNGFREIIDDVNGIDIYVDTSFTDYAYPTANHGYQVVSFQEGWQRMDGETALRYSRSRHGNNGEGSDFSRAKRQQKVLLALKEQLLTLRLLRDPSKISSLLTSLKANFSTNLQLGEILRLAKIGRAVDPGQIIHKVIGSGPKSLLVPTTVGGAYVLVPRNDDWDGLRQLADNLFVNQSDIVVETHAKLNEDPRIVLAKNKAVLEPSDIRLEILNGTGRTGLARRTADKLKGFGYRIYEIGNANNQARSQTTIYDLTGGSLSPNIYKLKDLLGVANPEITASPNPVSSSNRSSDLLIILGRDMPI